ncbi:MAG: S8 family serine peptidase [Planctomycetota bacterium]|nr:MAG: S8 family serine peptidase [Planctomycetota bacterium]
MGMKSLVSREILFAALVFVVLPAAVEVCARHVVFDVNSAPLLEPGRAERPEYVENEIIVKFRGNAADAVETGLAKGGSAKGLKLSDSLDELNKRYKLKKAKCLAKNFKQNRGRVKALLEKDEALLSKKERRIVERLKRAPKGARVPDLSGIYKLELELEAWQSLEEVVAAYGSDPDIEYAELNYIVNITASPNDAHYPIQWPLNNTGQMYPESGRYNSPPGTPDSDIDAPEAWDLHIGSSEIIVAVVDTGVDYAHRDLDDNMWVNEAELAGTAGVDDDGNGYVDDIYGYNFLVGNNDPLDDHGHGTHCAGIIASEGNNGLDIAGVCWKARIMALKFIKWDGWGETADAVPAFYYAVEHGADVISNSWGGGPYLQSLRDAIEYAHSQGVIMVASAGNNSTNSPQYPAYYEHMIAVAATNSNDEKAPFSNYGDWVDIAAPGVDVLSLRASGTSAGTVYDHYTTIGSGSSMAVPHIAGACALLLSVNPVLTNEDVYDVLMEGVDPIADGICLADGRLNLFKTILEAAPSKGRLNLDADYYTCSSVIPISLGDRDLEGRGSQEVTITSSGGDSETVVLIEREPPIGFFTGAISTASGEPNTEDGLLQLSHGEAITVIYDDADDGSGNPATTTDTAAADCEGPAVIDIVVDVPGPEPTVSFATSEPARARLACGQACGGPYIIEGASSILATSHGITLKGVSPQTEYFFIIEATDAHGNTEVHDNDGVCYSFTTDDGPGDIYVPGEDPNAPLTIQEAIDDSWDGGTVWVADGTYKGDGYRDIDFKGRAITVRSENGPENCIIDCYNSRQQWHRAFMFHSGEDGNYVVTGFTVINTGHQKYTPNEYGGGVSCIGSSPTVSNCIFSGRLGNAMANTAGSNPTVTNCTFRGNNRPAMFNEHSSPTVVKCRFIDNVALGNWSGGGMDNRYDSNPMVINCTFIGNRVGSVGGGMCNIESDPTVINCVFSGNRAGLPDPDDSGHGGGICNLSYDPAVTVVNCTFSGNSANTRGGGIADAYVGNSSVSNCLLWGNSDSNGVSESGQIHSWAPAVNYSCIEGLTGALGGTGNIGDNPLLMDADGLDDIVGTKDDNLRILPGSACVDAGDNTAVPASVTIDSDIWPRFVDDPNTPDTGSGAGAIVDMGAYEYQGRRDLYVDDDAGGDPSPGSPAAGDPLENGTQEHPFDTIQEAIDVAQDGDTIIVATGTYLEGINFGGKILTVISTDPNDAAVVAATVIDGGESGNVVSFANGEGADAVLAGFTITGEGVGIYLHGAFPTIINCTIEMEEGVAMDLWHASEPTIINCTIVGEVKVRPIVTNLRTGEIYDSIQDAIDDATGGDEIVVGEGIYYEGIDFKNKELIVRSTEPNDANVVASTIIEGGDRAVSFASGEGTSAVLAGLTIRDVNVGVWCDGASPIIINCTISGMVQGIYSNEGSVTILNCVVDSEASGIFCQSGSLTVRNCSVGGGSTGIRLEGGTGTIANCTIGSGDIALSCSRASPTVSGCTIIGENIGVYCYNAFPGFSNCTIIGYEVAALDLWHMSEPTVTDCNIVGEVIFHSTIENLRTGELYDYIEDAVNEASSGDELVAGEGVYYEENISVVSKGVTLRSTDPNDSAVVSRTIIRGHLDIGKWYSSEELVVSGFTFTDGGRISCNESSPTIANCAITGVTGPLGAIYCYDAHPTIINCTISGDPYAITRYYTSEPTIINCTIEGEILVGTVENLTSGRKYFVLIGNAISDAESGDEILAGEGVYYENIDFWGKEIKLRSRDPNDAAVVAATVIHGDANESVVSFTHNEGPSTVLSGFTITGGRSAGYGAAIACRRDKTRPRISNCIIAGNAGAGIYSETSRLQVTNCVIAGNGGAGIYALGRTNGTIINCTIVENGAEGIEACRGRPKISNCIIWDNYGDEICGSIDVKYSDIEGGYDGEGNIDAGPWFARPGYWAHADDLNMEVEPNDANAIWIGGDYHLLPGSPCVDAASDVNIYSDIEGNIRPFDYPDVDNNGELPEFDMGAYEVFMPWMEVPMKFTPRVLNTKSRGKQLKAHLILPEGFGVDDVDTDTPAMLEPLGIVSEKMKVFINDDGLVEIKTDFRRGDFCAGGNYGPAEVIVVGLLTSDEYSQYFYGRDTIKVTGNNLESLAALASHWLESNCRPPDWCEGVDMDRSSAVNFMDFAFFDSCCVEVITQQTGRGARWD